MGAQDQAERNLYPAEKITVQGKDYQQAPTT
jgi:hypothetical protein